MKLLTNFIFVFCLLVAISRGAVAVAQDGQLDGTVAVREEAALRSAVEKVADSVVQIRTIGGLDVVNDTPIASGPTTGLVISADGYILSSAFNFVQQPSSILVSLASGKQTAADLVATDHSRMLVLLKAKEVSGLPTPTIAPTDEVRVGDWAVAVGRTFRHDRTNVSVGIVSALGRMYGKVLQTDASISTANYGGPLVDIRGRVLGLVVPMAPQSTSEVAGVEWYDSGIGFAVPLSSVSAAIERMKKGEDQYPGLLGVSMAGRTPMSSSAVLAAVRPDSPAGKAGLKKGDRLVEADGRAVKTQMDLRLAMGPHYAGDSVRVTAKRGEETIERTVKLVGKLPAFKHAFLGILPLRANTAAAAAGANAGERGAADDDEESADENESAEKAGDETEKKAADQGDKDGKSEGTTPPSGVVVRMVYAGSPAAEAGIRAGDRIEQINGAKVARIADAIEQLNSVAPADEVTVSLARDDDSLDLKVKAARLPTTVPAELPPAYKREESEAAAAASETVDLKLAAMPQKCKVYLPAAHEAGRALGVLIWLHAPGDSKPDEVIAHWKSICDRDGLILVVPTAEDVKQWERTEIEYLGRLTERVMRQYRPDPRRVVVFGQAGSGGMAYLLGLAGRGQFFSGIATTAAPLPRQVKVPDSDPAQRLAVFSGVPNDAAEGADINQGLQKLSEAGYPVTTLSTADSGGRLADVEREELARWIDSLDRF